MKIRAHNDGAALVVALAVFAILFSIAVTFLMMSRMEMTSSVNVQNIGQAEMVAKAGVASATSVLNQDRRDHPNVTSTDHAWNSYFNGSWIAGKAWAFRWNGTNPERWAYWDTSVTPNVWVVNRNAVPQIFFDGPLPATVPTPVAWTLLEMLARLPHALTNPPSLLWDRTSLFVPREQNATQLFDDYSLNFLLRTDPVNTNLTPAQQVNLWADVDNDEDGLRDAMWIPMGSDKVMTDDGVDNDLDGIIDNKGEWEPVAAPATVGAPYYWGLNDLIDNDGDGQIDEVNEQYDNNGNGDVDEPAEQQWYTKAQPETGVFVYWGGEDGLDNNGDGLIDDATEQKYFLTVPLFGMKIRVVDKNGNPVDIDGHLIDMRHPDASGVFHCTQPDLGEMRFITISPTASITVSVPDDRLNPTGTHSSLTLSANDVDCIDNDYSMLINDYDIIAREARDFTLNEPRQYHEIAPSLPAGIFGTPIPSTPATVVTLCSPNVPVDPSALNGGVYASTVLDNLKSTTAGQQTIVSIQCTGEPVCEIVGRYAVTIRDEASKVNINTAGAFTYDDSREAHRVNFDPDNTNLPSAQLANDFPLLRSLNQGLGPQEYETRLLPYAVNNTFGSVETTRLANYRNGSADGTGLASEAMRLDSHTADVLNFPLLGLIYPTSMTPLASVAAAHGFLSFDANLPGYGRVDDNANALWLSIDGIDNDGDGLIDEGLNPGVNPGTAPVISTPAYRQWLIDNDRYAHYQALLNKTLEGIDEPQESLSASPLRNAIAAVDTQDNNSNGQVDEIDESGDRRFRTEEELTALKGVGDAVLRNLKPFISVNASTKNQAQTPYDPLQPALLSSLLSKPKLDPNYATATQIAEMLIGQGYRSDLQWNTSGYDLWGMIVGTPGSQYARGLRSSEMNFVVPMGQTVLGGSLGGPAIPEMVLPADDALRAMQMAVNIVDNRDTDFERTTLTTQDLQNVPVNQAEEWKDPLAANAPITYTVSGTEAIRISELMVRPVRRFEAEADAGNNNLNPNYFSDSAGQPDFALFTNTAPVRSWRETIFTHVASAAGLPFAITDVADFWSFYPLPANQCIGDVASIVTTFNDPNPGDGLYYRTASIPAGTTAQSLPNVIQYRFKPSPGLPPGRYYLTMNSTFRNAAGKMQPSVNVAGRLRYAIKYVQPDADNQADTATLSGTSILRDVENNYNIANDAVRDTYFSNNWIQIDAAHQELIGLDGQNQVTGQVFLPDRIDGTLLPLLGYRDGNVHTGCIADYACPVIVSATSDLLVAVAMDPLNTPDPLNPTPTLAVNYFEFSQEPDHEWVEVRNISDQPVEISGWELTVGYDTLLDPNFRRLTVPINSTIPANNSVLLAANKVESTSIAGLFLQDGIALTGTATLPPTVAYDAINAPEGHPAAGDVFTLNDSRIIGLQSSDLEGDTTWQRVASRVLGGGIFPNNPDHDGIDNDGDHATLAGTEGRWTGSSFFYIDDSTFTLNPTQLRGQVIRFNAAFTNGINGDNAYFITSVTAPNRLNLSLTPSGSVVTPAGPTVPAPPLAGIAWEIYTGIDENRWWMDVHRDGTPPQTGTPPPVPNLYPYGVPGGYDGLPINDTRVDLMAKPTESPDWRTFVQRRTYPGDCVIVTLYEGAAEQNRVVDRVTYTELDVVNRAIDDAIPCPYTAVRPFIGAAQAVLDGDAFRVGVVAHTSFWLNNTMGADFYCSLERKHPLFAGDRFGTSNRWTATDGNYDDWAPRTNRFETEYLIDTSATGSLTRNAAYVPVARHTNAFYAAKFNGTPLDDPLNIAPSPATKGKGVYEQFLELNPLTINSAFLEPEEADAMLPTPPDILRTWTFADYQRQIQWALQNSAWIRNRPYVSESDVLTTPQIGYTQRLVPDVAQFAIPPNSHYLLPQQSAPGTFNTAITVRADSSVVKALIGQPMRKIYSIVGDAEPVNTATGLPTGPLPPQIYPAAAGTPYLPENDKRLKDLRTVTGPSMAMDPMELSCGQAKFTAILPGGDFATLNTRMTWERTASGKLPTAWTPVMLFQASTVDTPGFNYVFTVDSPTPPPLPYILDLKTSLTAAIPDAPFMLDGTQLVLPAAISTVNMAAYLEGDPARWAPQFVASTTPVGPQRRAMAYVAAVDNDARNNGTAQAEALFEWTADAGLEPGTYDVYVVTCQNPDLQGYFKGAASSFLVTADPRISDNAVGGRGLLAQYRESCLTNNVKDMYLDIRIATSSLDVATPFETNPASPAATPEWSHPNSDGAIYYAAGPVTVTEDRYLALRLRNSTQTPLARLNMFTKVVLTPRTRVAGKINVNTAETRWVREPEPSPAIQPVLFNPLMGVPGLLEYATYDSDNAGARENHYPPAPNENLVLPQHSTSISFFADILNADYTFRLALATDPQRKAVALYDRVRRILTRRTEHWDARYYDVAGDLFVKVGEHGNGQGRYPLLPDYDAEALGRHPVPPDFNNVAYDGDTVPTRPNPELFAVEGPLFDEMLRRFARMQHLVTTRSDTFEIIVTAQSGYGVDADGDGLINWRKGPADNDTEETKKMWEFVPTAEKKIRTVYERPEPRQITQP